MEDAESKRWFRRFHPYSSRATKALFVTSGDISTGLWSGYMDHRGTNHGEAHVPEARRRVKGANHMSKAQKARKAAKNGTG